MLLIKKYKLLLSFIVCLVMFVSSTCLAQNKVLKLNTIETIISEPEVALEFISNNITSYQVSIGANFSFDNSDTTAYHIGISTRRYLTKKEVLRGFYLEASTKFRYGQKTTSIPLGTLLGYQFIMDSRIALDFGLGLRYHFPLQNDVIERYDGLKGHAQFLLGYRF